MPKRIHQIFLAAIGLSLTSCGINVPNVDLDGTLTILMPRQDLSLAQFKKEWIVIGRLRQALPTLQDDGIFLHLAIKSGPKPFAALRPINAQLLATPYLGWNWRIIEGTSSKSPLQIIIGFLDDKTESKTWSIGSSWRPNIPNFSRSLTIEWAPSALQRGFLEAPPRRNGPPVARYIARGGKENLNRWWREIVDLSALHAKAWPGLNMRDTRVVFAGIGVKPGDGGVAAHIRGLHLSR